LWSLVFIRLVQLSIVNHGPIQWLFFAQVFNNCLISITTACYPKWFHKHIATNIILTQKAWLYWYWNTLYCYTFINIRCFHLDLVFKNDTLNLLGCMQYWSIVWIQVYSTLSDKDQRQGSSRISIDLHALYLLKKCILAMYLFWYTVFLIYCFSSSTRLLIVKIPIGWVLG
jgi:hypothetical protein